MISTPGELVTSPLVYPFFYLVLFFAYWFGSTRFDYDNDGDFDPDDVQRFLEDRHVLKKNYRKKKKKGGKQQPKVQEPRPDQHPSEGLGTLSAEVEHELEDAFAAEISGGKAVEDEILHQTFPAFIVGQTLLALLFWIVAAIYLSARDDNFDKILKRKAGIDTFSDGWSDLRLTDGNCEDFRGEVWRYFTYQWTHIGVAHILLNCIMNLVLGIPLEGLHGHLRLMLMYNVGVFGGACCYWVGDAHKRVVGMSGGCYSLLGMHVANLLMNWHQMKFRWLTVLFLLIMVTVEAVFYFGTIGNDNSSHVAHLGGLIAGGLISTVVGTNLVVHRWERIVQIVTVGLACCLGLWCVIHLIVNDAPRHIGEDYGWCFVGQVYDKVRFGNVWQCVQCASKACIDTWQNTAGADLAAVSIFECQGGFYFEGKMYDP